MLVLVLVLVCLFVCVCVCVCFFSYCVMCCMCVCVCVCVCAVQFDPGASSSSLAPMPRFTKKRDLEVFITDAEKRRGVFVRPSVLQARKLAAEHVLYI